MTCCCSRKVAVVDHVQLPRIHQYHQVDNAHRYLESKGNIQKMSGFTRDANELISTSKVSYPMPLPLRVFVCLFWLPPESARQDMGFMLLITDITSTLSLNVSSLYSCIYVIPYLDVVSHYSDRLLVGCLWTPLGKLHWPVTKADKLATFVIR